MSRPEDYRCSHCDNYLCVCGAADYRCVGCHCVNCRCEVEDGSSETEGQS